jgi:hypothetical protein
VAEQETHDPSPRIEASAEAEANGSVEASPAVPEWMQKFREMGLW